MIYAKMAILVMHVMPVLGHMVVPKHGVVMKDGCLQLVAGVDCSNQLKLRLVGGLHPPLASERHDTPFHNQQDGLYEPSQVQSHTCEDGSVNNKSQMVWWEADFKS